MTKKLKIRFVKFKNALAMQILEQVGKFENTEHVKIAFAPELCFCRIYLRSWESDNNLKIDYISFPSNNARDEHLASVINWITDEQFTNTSRAMKVGDWCEVRDYENDVWTKRKLIAVLPKQYLNRYICEMLNENKKTVCSWTYARPLVQRVEPTIDGDVYTWEM